MTLPGAPSLTRVLAPALRGREARSPSASRPSFFIQER